MPRKAISSVVGIGGMMGAIDTGFKRARATIIDANMTHLIAAMILFELLMGNTPFRGLPAEEATIKLAQGYRPQFKRPVLPALQALFALNARANSAVGVGVGRNVGEARKDESVCVCAAGGGW